MWVREGNSSSRPLQPLPPPHLTPGGGTTDRSHVEWTDSPGGDKDHALWVKTESTDVSRQAWCDSLDQVLQSNVSEIILPNRTPEKGGRGGETGVCLFHWEKCRLRENFPSPFKNIKDTMEKITTCYSFATKDNKRNGIELWQGKTGLNRRKTFLTSKVIKHRKGKLEAIRDALWRSLKKQNSLATIWR